jgi:hypothetical protein
LLNSSAQVSSPPASPVWPMFFAARCWSAPLITSAVTRAAKATLFECSICCRHFWGFVHHHVHFTADRKRLETSVRPRKTYGRHLLALPLAHARIRPIRAERCFEFAARPLAIRSAKRTGSVEGRAPRLLRKRRKPAVLRYVGATNKS